MNRRSFLAVAAAAPVAIATPVVAGPAPNLRGLRVSTDPDDAGYLAWVEARSDGKAVRVLLDGQEQKDCTMADETLGALTRIRRTAAGNIMVDPHQGVVIHETVTGDVRIEMA